MKKAWNTILTIGAWILGIILLIFGSASLFVYDFWLTKALGGFIALIGILTLPLIRNKFKHPITGTSLLILFIVGFIGMIASNSMNTPGEESDEPKYLVTADTLNVRAGEGTQYEILFKIYRDDGVEVLAENEGWYHISTKEERGGYVSSKYIENVNADEDSTSGWAGNLIILAILFYLVFIKGGSSKSSRSYSSSSGSSSSSASSTSKSKSIFDNTEPDRLYFLIIKDRNVYHGKEKRSDQTQVFGRDNAVDCDLEDPRDDRSRFLAVTDEGNVVLCQLKSSGTKKVYYNGVANGRAYKARFASADSFYFDTDQGKYKGYFNSTKTDKLS